VAARRQGGILTDAELKQLMKQLAAATGLVLTDERVDRDLIAYKSHLAAIDRIKAVPLPMEAEPFVGLKR
jgi:hypothetical protein